MYNFKKLVTIYRGNIWERSLASNHKNKNNAIQVYGLYTLSWISSLHNPSSAID